LEAREEGFEGDEKKLFLSFIKPMLRWDPKDQTARELMDDPCLNDYEI
jgi:hypothetical protein